MAVTPWRTILADKSPFVEMFVLISLPAAASIVNFVVLTSAASSANSGVFLRAACYLAYQKKAMHQNSLVAYRKSRACNGVNIYLHLPKFRYYFDLLYPRYHARFHVGYYRVSNPIYVYLEHDLI